jgi:hypothetical protein
MKQVEPVPEVSELIAAQNALQQRVADTWNAVHELHGLTVKAANDNGAKQGRQNSYASRRHRTGIIAIQRPLPRQDAESYKKRKTDAVQEELFQPTQQPKRRPFVMHNGSN